MGFLGRPGTSSGDNPMSEAERRSAEAVYDAKLDEWKKTDPQRWETWARAIRKAVKNEPGDDLVMVLDFLGVDREAARRVEADADGLSVMRRAIRRGADADAFSIEVNIPEPAILFRQRTELKPTPIQPRSELVPARVEMRVEDRDAINKAVVNKPLGNSVGLLVGNLLRGEAVVINHEDDVVAVFDELVALVIASILSGRGGSEEAVEWYAKFRELDSRWAARLRVYEERIEAAVGVLRGSR